MATFVDDWGFLRIIQRRKSLVLLCLVIGLVGGSFFCLHARPAYQSEAQVLVVRKRPEAVTGENKDSSPSEDYISTHRILIQSPVIVERAIRLGNLHGLQTFAEQQGDLTESLIMKLSVGRVSRDALGNPISVLSLSFRGPVAEECGTIVNAVLDSYRTFLDEAYRNMGDDTIKLIAETQRILHDDLEKREAAYREFREHSPMLWKGKDEVNPLQDRLAQIETQRLALLLRKADLEGQLHTLDNAKKAGKNCDALVALVSDLAQGGQDPRGRQLARRGEGNPPPAGGKSDPEHQLRPTTPRGEGRSPTDQALHDFFVLPASVAVEQAEAGAGDNASPTPNFVEDYTQYLNRQRDEVLGQEAMLAKLFQGEHDTARKLNSYEIQDAELRNGIARTEAMYDGLVKRLQEAGLAKDYGGYYARVIAPAGIGKKVFPNVPLVLAECALLSLLCGVGMAFLAESNDKSFRNFEEICGRLGLPVMACIPFVASNAAIRQKKAAGGTFDPMLIAHYQPKSIAAESYRGVRTALYFSDGGDGHKVLQFTSPAAGDGKSVLAANLAVSIAQSGKRTLLIDADLRKPQMHKIFSLSSSLGLTLVISGDVECADAIQDSSIPNLSVLPGGPAAASPAELLTSPRLVELLHLFREQYDYVLLDSPPVLAVTDASVVAHHVDGVVLVVRTSRNCRPMAQRRTRRSSHPGCKDPGRGGQRRGERRRCRRLRLCLRLWRHLRRRGRPPPVEAASRQDAATQSARR